MEDIKQSVIEIYEESSGGSKVEVRVLDDSVWLSLKQLSQLFGRDKSVISRHIKKLFSEDELDKDATVAYFATVRKEGDRGVQRDIEYFNLDVTLSVGYRVNSKTGTRFRRWASGILKSYLLEGYSLNQDKLVKSKIIELQNSIDLMSNALTSSELIKEPGSEIIEIIRNYSKTWDLLIKYDEDNLTNPDLLQVSSKEILPYGETKSLIADFKNELGIAGIFGVERGDALKGILGNIMQSFGGEYLYPTIQEKAAHLLYFIIKDHPFSDGNKRIGSLLFLLYLKKSGIDIPKMNENTLTALALLTAESNPSQKDLVIKLIMNLIG